MSVIEVAVIGVGLSMDAFAVSVGKGLSSRRAEYRPAMALALTFGVFQAAMPLAGWALSSLFSGVVESLAGWIAFALLVGIGAKMMWDGLHGPDAPRQDGGTGVFELLALGVATSIDAFAVGVSFALLGVAPMPSAAIIGAITFAMSLFGFLAGSKVGGHAERHASLLGGAILICIGVKTLLFP